MRSTVKWAARRGLQTAVFRSRRTAARSGKRLAATVSAALCALLIGVAPAASAQMPPDAPSAPRTQAASTGEAYRLRVENMQYGRIEISADGGAWRLIGRVMTPALTAAPGREAKSPGTVLRAGPDAIVFAVAPGFTMRLCPAASPGAPKARRNAFVPPEASALRTNLPARQGLFGSDLAPARAAVLLQSGPDATAPFPDGYTPAEEDVFVFSVPPSAPAAGSPDERAGRQRALQGRLEALANAYGAGSVARARAEGRMVVNGTLTVHARLPAGEPDPVAAVTYLIDGDVVAAQNTPPFSYAWDTRKAPEGEHVVEIRALNSKGGPVTRARTLVVVHNAAP